MDIFEYAFTLLMILCPAVITLFVRPRHDDAEQLARGQKINRILWLATAACVVLYLLLARWQPAVAHYMWMAFFPLWFNLAMPLLRTRIPEWQPAARESVRSASLVRRDVLPSSLLVGWIAITVLWGLLLVVSILGLMLAVSQQWWLLIFNLAAGFELAVLFWSMRRSLIEPETVSAGETDELRAERDSFHRLKLNGWFWLASVAMLIFSLPPLLLIWFGNPALMWAIWIGAGGGTLAGIGGGVFGTVASMRRARINRLCLESAPTDDSA